MNSQDIYGWFESTNPKPDYDPIIDAGGVRCIVCMKRINRPADKIKTISVMGIDFDKSLHPLEMNRKERCYFFRAHTDCWNSCADDEKTNYESSFIDCPPAIKDSLKTGGAK